MGGSGRGYSHSGSSLGGGSDGSESGSSSSSDGLLLPDMGPPALANLGYRGPTKVPSSVNQAGFEFKNTVVRSTWPRKGSSTTLPLVPARAFHAHMSAAAAAAAAAWLGCHQPCPSQVAQRRLSGPRSVGRPPLSSSPLRSSSLETAIGSARRRLACDASPEDTRTPLA